MIGTVGKRCRSAATMARVGCDDVAAELRRRQHAGPAVEQHDGFGAGLDLRRQVAHRAVGQQCDQPLEQRRFAVGHGPRGGEIPRTAAFDHVAGNGERRAGKADQRAVGKSFAASPARTSRTVSRIGAIACRHTRFVQRLQARGVAQRRQDRSLALAIRQPMAQRPWQHQDVAEQDGSIEAEAADRLQRHLGRQRRRRAQRNEIRRAWRG